MRPTCKGYAKCMKPEHSAVLPKQTKVHSLLFEWVQHLPDSADWSS